MFVARICPACQCSHPMGPKTLVKAESLGHKKCQQLSLAALKKLPKPACNSHGLVA